MSAIIANVNFKTRKLISIDKPEKKAKATKWSCSCCGSQHLREEGADNTKYIILPNSFTSEKKEYILCEECIKDIHKQL